MSLINEELKKNCEITGSYLETTSSIGIVLLDPELKILDCNLGFMKLFDCHNRPVGATVADYLQLRDSDIEQSGEFKVSFNKLSGADGIICCHLLWMGNIRVLFCERVILTESRAMEQFGVINNELINLGRESIKKTLLLEKLQKTLDARVAELEATLARVKQLEGLISICMYCKKIRTGQDNWQQLEKYISEHSEVQFSHGMCPKCYDEQMEKMRREFGPDFEKK